MILHPTKGHWVGSQSLYHLSVHLYTVVMRMYVSDRKVALVMRLSKKVLAISQHKRRLVPLVLVRYFSEVCVSLTIGFPMSRLYTRSIYIYMSLAGHKKR